MACGIVELVKLLYEDFEEFCKRLKKFKEVGLLEDLRIDKKGKVVSAIGPLGVGATVMQKADPLTNYVSLCLLFYGQYFVYMRDIEMGFEEVKKWWKSKVKGKR